MFNPSDKVVCIDDTPGNIHHHNYPYGYVKKGSVYCVERCFPSGTIFNRWQCPYDSVFIVGLPVFVKEDGTQYPWQCGRFRKLDEIKAENTHKKERSTHA
jgi:hypothetical protein